MSVKTHISNIAREVLHVYIRPSDSGWQEIGGLARVYGRDKIVETFDAWARSQQTVGKYPLRDFVTVADALIQSPDRAKPDALCGKHFHSYEDGRIRWQGRIVANLGDGYYLAQLYEWVAGTETSSKVIHISNVRDWEFYDSDEEMNDAYHTYSKRRERTETTAEPH